MTEHKHAAPDDGGPAYPLMVGTADRIDNVSAGMSLRARLAMQFAAAWLPRVNLAAINAGALGANIGGRSNELGLAMADDLIRRMRESA